MDSILPIIIKEGEKHILQDYEPPIIKGHMIIKKLLLCSMAITYCCATIADTLPPYRDKSLPTEQRINDLLGRMTLEEKILQLNQYTLGINTNENNQGEVAELPAGIGSVIYNNQDPELRNTLQRRAMTETRLGIPVLFGFDVIHGFRTIFPIPLAQSCSWNPNLVEKACKATATEARTSGVDWTFSPMVDVARDARWGRISEGYGEDPYTAGVFAAAVVKGYQNDTLSDRHTVASCLKHYVGYGASEAGLDYVYTEISRSTLWNAYLIPFEQGVAAGAPTLMSGFNDISGTPATCNKYTLTDVLRGKWGFDGFVVSDWTAVEQLINQGVAADRRQAAELALMAGVDMDMLDNCYREHLASLVNEGRVPMERIDQAVASILKLKFELGLFEHPYTEEIPRNKRILLPHYRKLADSLAAESAVLLKNNDNILPLDKHDKIAVIGPMIHNQIDLNGWWWGHGMAEDVITIADAMNTEFGKRSQVVFAEGCDIDGNNRNGMEQAAETAADADIVVVCLGEKRRSSGENAPMATISLPAAQEELVTAIKQKGKKVVLALYAGRPIDISRIEPMADAILMMWQPGISGGRTLAGMLSGRINPSGKLSVTYPRSVAQIPIYYNRRPSSRPVPLGQYLDIPSTPMYEFGHGLSYTTYSYGEPVATTTEFTRDGKVTISIPVTNTGSREGMETVLWYINDPACSISRPVKELKFFEKKSIRPNATQTFTFNIQPMRDLSYRDDNGNPILEAGDYYVIVGDKKLKLTLKD